MLFRIGDHQIAPKLIEKTSGFQKLATDATIVASSGRSNITDLVLIRKPKEPISSRKFVQPPLR